MPFDGSLLTQTQRDLIAARALLVEKGWVPECGNYCDQTAQQCIMSAIWHASRDDKRARNARLRIRDYINGSIAEWNDAQTSITPILALFDRAIAEAGE